MLHFVTNLLWIGALICLILCIVCGLIIPWIYRGEQGED